METELRQRLPGKQQQQQQQQQPPPSLPPSVAELKRLKTITHLHHAAAPAYVSSPSLLFFFCCFSCLLPVRLLSALYTPIQDCDETFNYWEPTHYLQHGYGLQTWEYSPVYALRSYLYIYLHVVAIKAVQLIGLVQLLTPAAGLTKIGEFYALRVLLAVFCALVESSFVYAIASRCRRSIAVITAGFLVTSAGMFHASVAYVPSSFTMYFVMLCWRSWILQQYSFAILCMAICALIGWPFSVILGIPLGLDIVVHYRSRLHLPILWAIGSAAVCVIPSVLLDYHYYQHLLLAVFNLAVYNSQTSKDGGANLYGIAPASYYVFNLLLNFNAAVVLAVISPCLALILYLLYKAPVDRLFLKWISALFIWLALMFAMPHKEERFLFVVYPLVCFSAAYALVYTTLIIRQWFCCVVDRKARKSRNYTRVREDENGEEEQEETEYTKIRSSVGLSLPFGYGSITFLTTVLIVIGFLSAARMDALILNYQAPLLVYEQLAERVSTSSAVATPVSVCVGKEWYRFPSHYFLPSSTSSRPHAQLQFLRSSFNGLLPRHYLSSYNESSPHPSHQLSLSDVLGPDRVLGTSVIPPYQNDQNREEPERYVVISKCDYIVDLDLVTQKEEHYHQMRESYVEPASGCRVDTRWEVVYESPFLDADSSPSWARSLYIPYFSKQYNQHRPYQLLQRKHTRHC